MSSLLNLCARLVLICRGLVLARLSWAHGLRSWLVGWIALAICPYSWALCSAGLLWDDCWFPTYRLVGSHLCRCWREWRAGVYSCWFWGRSRCSSWWWVSRGGWRGWARWVYWGRWWWWLLLFRFNGWDIRVHIFCWWSFCLRRWRRTVWIFFLLLRVG